MKCRVFFNIPEIDLAPFWVHCVSPGYIYALCTDHQLVWDLRSDIWFTLYILFDALSINAIQYLMCFLALNWFKFAPLGTECNFLKAPERAFVHWNWGRWCCSHINRQQGNWYSGPSRRTGTPLKQQPFHDLPLFFCFNSRHVCLLYLFPVQHTEDIIWRTCCWNVRGS